MHYARQTPGTALSSTDAARVAPRIRAVTSGAAGPGTTAAVGMAGATGLGCVR